MLFFEAFYKTFYLTPWGGGGGRETWFWYVTPILNFKRNNNVSRLLLYQMPYNEVISILATINIME